MCFQQQRTVKNRQLREKNICLEHSKVKGFIFVMTGCEIGCGAKKKKIKTSCSMVSLQLHAC